MVDVGGEGGVTAVVGPVGIHHADFRDGGVALFLVSEIALQEFQIVQIHGKTKIVQQRCQRGFIHDDEALHGGDGLGRGVDRCQGFRQLQRCLTAFHRVDDVLFEGGNLRFGKGTVQRIDLGGADPGTIPLRNDLDTLGGRVGTLIKLTGQCLHGKYKGTGQIDFPGSDVQLGLGENGSHGIVKKRFRDIFRVIAVEKPDALQSFHTQKVLRFAQQAPGFVVQTFLFLHKNTINHWNSLLTFLQAMPADRCRICGTHLRTSRRRKAGRPP